MKKYLLRTCLFLFLGFGTMVQSKSQSLLGIHSVYAPDTVFASIPDSFFVFVKNTGLLLFNGPVTLHVRLNDSIDFVFDSLPMILPPNALGVAGWPFFPFDTLGLEPADNIVVVWPTGSGITTSDSLTFSLYFVDDVSIFDMGEKIKIPLVLYPNPCGRTFYFTVSDPGKKVEEVRILDILGRSIPFSRNQNRLDLPGGVSGLHFIQVFFADGARSQSTILVQQGQP